MSTSAHCRILLQRLSLPKIPFCDVRGCSLLFVAVNGKRFRDHTCALFKKHGIEIVGFWIPTDKEKGAENTLVYLLAHKSREEAKKSWAAFGADPDWKKAREDSEVNGKLTEKVESVFLAATDYSPMK